MKKVILLLIILFVFAPNVVNANDISISPNEVYSLSKILWILSLL